MVLFYPSSRPPPPPFFAAAAAAAQRSSYDGAFLVMALGAAVAASTAGAAVCFARTLLTGEALRGGGNDKDNDAMVLFAIVLIEEKRGIHNNETLCELHRNGRRQKLVGRRPLGCCCSR